MKNTIFNFLLLMPNMGKSCWLNLGASLLNHKPRLHYLIHYAIFCKQNSLWYSSSAIFIILYRPKIVCK